MAFSERYTPSPTERCAVCRRKYTDGRTLLIKAYRRGTEHVCRACYKRFYKQAADLEAGSNLMVQLRPADIRERGAILRREEPEGGYEFRMPHIIAAVVIRDFVIWIMLLSGIELLLRLGTGALGYEIEISPAWVVFRLIAILITALILISNLRSLISGIFRGMGHFRRLVLLGITAAAAVMLFILFP